MTPRIMQKRNTKRAAMILLLFLNCNLVFALPQGGESVSGNVQFSQQGDTLNVSSGSNRSIANYQSFSIDGHETVNFNLPNSSSVMLNRVTGGDPSSILGSMNSNGRIFLINPNGVFIGAGANINVGGLFASTLNINDKDFLNNNLVFYQDANHAPASIVNEGNINIHSGGFAVLAAGAVRNSGEINAPSGNIQLAVGDQIKATISDVALVDLTVTESLKNKVDGFTAAIANAGNITADGGIIKLQADLARNVYQQAINQEGMIRAQSVQNQSGVIELLGTSDEQNALVLNTGILDASGYDSGETGGTVHVLGDYVALSENAIVDTSGDAGGGQINIGGNFQGKGELYNAQRTLIEQNVQIKNDAITTGDGGRSILWADDAMFYYGTLSAQGGSLSGNGGFAEVSGKIGLDFQGLVNLSAANGETGTLLLDPQTINVVDSGGTAAIADVSTFGIFPGTTQNINAGVINLVGTTANVTLQATQDVNFLNTTVPISLSATPTSRTLTVQAGQDINLNGSTIFAPIIIMQAGRHLVINQSLSATGTITLGADAVVNAISSNGIGDITLAANVATTSVSNVAITLNGVNIIQTTGGLSTGATGRLNITATNGGDATLNSATNSVGIIAVTGSGATTDVSFTNNRTLSMSTPSNLNGGNLTLVTTAGNIDSSGQQISNVNRLSATAPGSVVFGNPGNTLTTVQGSGSSVQFNDTNGFTVESITSTGTVTLGASGAGSTINQTGPITGTTLAVSVPTTGNVILNNASNNVTNFQAQNGAVIEYTDSNTFNMFLSGNTTTNMTLTALNGGNITQSGRIFANNLIVNLVGGGDATLTNAANNVNTFSANATGANTLATLVQYLDTNGFAVATSNLGLGDLILTANNGGNITQTGGIIANVFDVNMVNGGDATLTNPANNVDIFAGDATGTNTQNTQISYLNTDSFELTTSNLGQGDLSLTANNGGNIVNTGTLSGDRLALTLNGGGDAIFIINPSTMNSLAVSANNINTNVQYADTDSIILEASNLGGGDLALTALNGGNITQSGSLTGTNVLSMTVIGGGDATLTNAGNDVNTFSANATGANTLATLVQYVDTNGFAVAASDLGLGDLILTANNGGNITQTGAITANGFDVNMVGGGDATLTNNANNVDFFSGDATGANTQNTQISYLNTDSFELATSNLGQGDLNLTANNGGNITKSGTLSGDRLSLTLNGGGDAVFLVGSTNMNSLAVSANNANTLVQYTDNDSIILEASNLGGGDLSLTALNGGSITQTGALLADELTVTTSGSGNSTLTNAGNNVNTFSAVAGTGTTAYTDTNGFTVASITSAGPVTLSANAAGSVINQTGPITGTTLTVNVPATGSVLLATSPNNDVTNFQAPNGASIDYMDSNSFNMLMSGSSSSNMFLTALNGGNITQTGRILANGLLVNMIGGGDATLTNTANNVASASFNAFGSTAVNTLIQYVDTDGFNVSANGSLMNGGDLSLQANNGGNITQTGVISADQLAVTLGSGGDATLTNPANNINSFSGNVTGSPVSTTLIQYVDTNGFDITGVTMNGADLELTTNNGGNITQSGPVSADELTIHVDGGGDAPLTNPANNIVVFRATATGANTANSDVSISDVGGTNLGAITLNDGNFNLIKQSGNTSQSGPLQANRVTITANAGGSHSLTNAGSDINTLSVTANNAPANVLFHETDGFSIEQANMNGGILILGEHGGGVIDQVGSTGPILADTLQVNLFDGSTAELTRTDNDVRALQANNNSNNTNAHLTYVDSNDLILAPLFTMSNGDVDITVLNGGNLTQTGPVTADVLTVTASGGGDVLLTDPANDIDGLSANADTGDTTVTNTGDLALLSGNSGTGTLDVSTTGTMSVPAGQTPSSNNGRMLLRAGNMNIQGTIDAGISGFIMLVPITTSTSIGIGTSSLGVFNLSEDELQNLIADTVQFGDETTTGNMDIGTADLQANNTHYVFNTLGTITDALPGNDPAFNLLLAADKNTTFTGGWDGTGDPMLATGSAAVGATPNDPGDLDILYQGSGQAFAKVIDASATGTSINLTSALSNIFINVVLPVPVPGGGSTNAVFSQLVLQSNGANNQTGLLFKSIDPRPPLIIQNDIDGTLTVTQDFSYKLLMPPSSFGSFPNETGFLFRNAGM